VQHVEQDDVAGNAYLAETRRMTIGVAGGGRGNFDSCTNALGGHFASIEPPKAFIDPASRAALGRPREPRSEPRCGEETRA
jgi:hypothetical protein